jgi:hypothetical protein
MGIYVCILLCLENEEEIVEEEETAPPTKTPPAENSFYFDVCGTDPESPTPLQHKASPGAFALPCCFKFFIT